MFEPSSAQTAVPSQRACSLPSHVTPRMIAMSIFTPLTASGSITTFHASIVLVLVCTSFESADAQTFTSGSNGSDGALDLTGANPGQIVFDPATFTPPLDTDGDNIFHFTSVTIPEGVELVFEARRFDYAPISWLASGAVQIDGTLNLKGDDGHSPTERFYAEPGPGGFHGGVGGRGASPATSGLGPGGGSGGANISGGSFGSRGGGNFPGPVYGNRYLLPLVGGSGGGGVRERNGIPGAGGGAGGGVILIASTVSVTLGGTINVVGGNGITGGAGGGVRILSPIFGGSGTINAAGGRGAHPLHGGLGRIRVETTRREFTGTLSGTGGIVTLPPNPVVISGPRPRVRISRIDGVTVSQAPTGSFEVPDVAIDSLDPVTVEIHTQQIPPGSIVQLLLITEDSNDVTVETQPIEGTLAQGTGTAQVTFEPGFSTVFLRARW